MIDKREVLEMASALGLLPNIVEKDYVLGWILAGINAHDELADTWVFKGGTCLKKCYFETYRFSEDLDFTLRAEGHINEDFLRRVLGEVVEWVEEQSGLAVPADQMVFDIYENPRGRICSQGRIGYRGPVSPTVASGGWPKIKLDLSADERLVLPPVRREVFHAYSDRPPEGIWINCYSYEEAFGEKVRALGERTRPRDLYDVVNLYRHDENLPAPSVLRDVLKQKCEYKGIPLPTLATLEPHRADLEAMWHSMLAHQLPVLPPVADFWAALAEIFDWIMTGAQAPHLARIQPTSDEVPVRNRVLPTSIPTRARAPLEIIRFAAANYLCVDLNYDGSVRRIEPYSLRRTKDGNYVLHAVRRDSSEHRSYRVDRMQGATVTSESFAPRYVIELTSTGSLTAPPTVVGSLASNVGRSSTRVQSRRRPTVQRAFGAAARSGLSYIYRCVVCSKQFRKKSMDGSLKAHKNRRGYDCPGRVGVYVRTKY